jgi:hypothetical protein
MLSEKKTLISLLDSAAAAAAASTTVGSNVTSEKVVLSYGP